MEKDAPRKRRVLRPKAAVWLFPMLVVGALDTGCSRTGFWNEASSPTRRALRIDPTLVSGGNSLFNYPLLVAIEDPALRTIVNGGHVVHGSGFDIHFTGPDGFESLDHEVEHYDGTNGALVAWVRVPELLPTALTTLYLHYGDVTFDFSTEDPAGVWDTDYAAVLHLHEDPSSVEPQFIDSTQNGNHGTASSGMTSGQQVDGIVGEAVAMDGDDYVVVDHTSSLDITQELTIEFWIYTAHSAHTGETEPIYKHFSTDNGWYIMVRGNEGALGFAFHDRTQMLYDYVDSHTLPTDEWVFMAVTYSLSNNVVKFFNNGSPVDVQPVSTAIRQSSADVYLGGRWGDLYPGLLDEVRISKRARNDDWMLTQYNNHVAPELFVTLGLEE